MKSDYYMGFVVHETKGRCDMTPILEDKNAFSNLIKDLIKPFKKEKINKIVALEALGFVLGSAMANKLGVGLVLARKGGKLPREQKNLLKQSFIDYTKTKKSFEISKSAIKKGEKVLIVDEWVETGAQMKAVINLVKKAKGQIIGICVLSAEKNSKTKILFEKYNLTTIRTFER
jgi:adenine phosphoribosyltransferase